MAVGESRKKADPCAHCGWAERCFQPTLTPDEQSAWKALFTPKSFFKGETIFWEDEAAEGLYVVCSGVVKLFKSVDNGGQQIVRLVGPGRFFGLPPLLNQKAHLCTCKAVDQTHIHFIPRQLFLDFLENFPPFTLRLIAQLAEELGRARVRLLDFGFKNGKQRIADLLLWLGQEFGRATPAGMELDIDLTRADFAGMAGLTTETTIRILSLFRRDGMIAAGPGKRIVLCDEEHLQTVSGDSRQGDCDEACPY